MFKRSFHSLLATWLAGLIALLPLALSLALLGWLVSLLNQLIGPTSFIGKLFAGLGQPFVSSPELAWLLGTLALVVALYPLGLAVQLGLKGPLRRLFDRTLRRIPLLGNLFNGERVTPTLAGGTLLILLGLAVHQREALLPMRRRSRRN